MKVGAGAPSTWNINRSKHDGDIGKTVKQNEILCNEVEKVRDLPYLDRG